jgi:polyhydroxybutyrate depolymerase
VTSNGARSALALAVATASCSPNFADDCRTIAVGPGDMVTCVVPGWVDRAFDLRVPASWDGSSPLPLVIAYHGGGGNREATQRITCPTGTLGEVECLANVATARGFAIVSPDGTGGRPLRDVRTWNAGGGTPGAYCASGAACAMKIDDIGYTDDLLVEVGAAIAIDPRRIYATGLSNGGAMSHRIACERASVIAAVVPVGGANQHADGGGACGRAAVMHIHGTDDGCWPYDGGTGSCIEEKGRKTAVPETMAGWVQRNACSAAFTDTPIPDRDTSDGASAERRAWTGCTAATELVTIRGGGHVWPNGFRYLDGVGAITRDFGNELILDFFDAHPLP